MAIARLAVVGGSVSGGTVTAGFARVTERSGLSVTGLAVAGLGKVRCPRLGAGPRWAVGLPIARLKEVRLCRLSVAPTGLMTRVRALWRRLRFLRHLALAVAPIVLHLHHLRPGASVLCGHA